MIHSLPSLPLIPPTRREHSSSSLVGTSLPMFALKATIERFARSKAAVLIEGESGVGKELVAQALHAASENAQKPLVAANVAALTPELLTSELFGHMRGAFTGAVTRHRGLFEQAHESTLFLDEIGELRPVAQAALLRVLETGELRPLGSERAQRVRVRLITATHRNLAAMVDTGTFRLDLFHRLSVLTLFVPPLRARLADLPALVQALLARRADTYGSRSVSASALDLLASCPWPGNVRELANVLERACALSDTPVLDAADVRSALGTEGTARSSPRHERPSPEQLRSLLAMHAGSIRAVARSLGVARSTVRAWVSKDGALDPYALHPPRRARSA